MFEFESKIVLMTCHYLCRVGSESEDENVVPRHHRRHDSDANTPPNPWWVTPPNPWWVTHSSNPSWATNSPQPLLNHKTSKQNFVSEPHRLNYVNVSNTYWYLVLLFAIFYGIKPMYSHWCCATKALTIKGCYSWTLSVHDYVDLLQHFMICSNSK